MGGPGPVISQACLANSPRGGSSQLTAPHSDLGAGVGTEREGGRGERRSGLEEDQAFLSSGQVEGLQGLPLLGSTWGPGPALGTACASPGKPEEGS